MGNLLVSINSLFEKYSNKIQLEIFVHINDNNHILLRTNQEETRYYADTILSRALTNETLLSDPYNITDAYNFTDTTDDYISTTISDITDTIELSNISTTLPLLSDSLMLDPENITDNTNSTFENIEEIFQNVTQTKNSLFATNTCIYIYTVCIIGSIVLTTLRSLVFFKVCMNSSIGLHNKMFNNILQATMRFFDTNPSGKWRFVCLLIV